MILFKKRKMLRMYEDLTDKLYKIIDILKKRLEVKKEVVADLKKLNITYCYELLDMPKDLEEEEFKELMVVFDGLMKLIAKYGGGTE